MNLSAIIALLLKHHFFILRIPLKGFLMLFLMGQNWNVCYSLEENGDLKRRCKTCLLGKRFHYLFHMFFSHSLSTPTYMWYFPRSSSFEALSFAQEFHIIMDSLKTNLFCLTHDCSFISSDVHYSSNTYWVNHERARHWKDYETKN